MFIWQYVDLDPSEVKKMQDAYLKILPRPSHFFQTVDVGIKEFMGMPIFKTVLIQALPNSVGIIHRDHRPYDNNTLAINIPLINCQDSVTEFWDTDDSNIKVSYTSSGSPYINIPRSQCTKMSEFILDRPVVFNTYLPHSVHNKSSQPRLAISLRLVTDPWHLVNGYAEGLQ